MLWVVHCLDKDNTAGLREKNLQEHRDYLNKVESCIVFSGPLQSDDASSALGSLFIINVEGRKEAQKFIDDEPFNKKSIFESVKIHRVRKGRFNPGLVEKI